MNLMLEDLINRECYIADLGCGAVLSYWYNLLGPNHKVDAYDLEALKSDTNDKVSFHQADVVDLYKNPNLKNKYDIVVADHIFEHVSDPESLAKSIAHILKPGGYVHIGIPDATNFTDIFYHLIHRDGGGHIQKFSLESFAELMKRHGFNLVDYKPWPDDWIWLDSCYNMDYNGVKYVTKQELKYIADVFRKELTADKGYNYGWEFVFTKKFWTERL